MTFQLSAVYLKCPGPRCTWLIFIIRFNKMNAVGSDGEKSRS